MSEHREIPFNYTSYTDREIVLRLLGSEAWDDLNVLRSQRRTGRSARMLFEVLGDVWLAERNAFVRHDLVRNRARREAMRRRHRARVQWIIDHAGGNERALKIAARTSEMLNRFYAALEETPALQQKVKRAFARHTHPANILFDPYTLTHHATDATDWRAFLPFCVLTPEDARELPGIVRTARALGLKLVPRGGGTGLCGGSVPLDAKSVVVNLEKLDWIGEVEWRDVGGKGRVPTIAAGAGAVTGRVMERARPHVFATDPTSLWACTIGGNVATNAGGKHAVLWGTCLDNLLSWTMVTPAGDFLTVERLDHNLGKIHDEETVRFRLVWTDGDGAEKREELLELPGGAFRKEGLGKDVTRKALGGLPGVQKEGTDGFIVEARFVLHERFPHTRTVCCEFFGRDLARGARAIAEIKARIAAMDGVVIEGLEHFDRRYAKAIDYAVKSARGELPKAVLLVDVSGDDERRVAEAANEVCRIAEAGGGEGFVAASPEDRARFWSDRARLAAIARHTRAFKLNEDVVIPLESLAAYEDFVERLNIECSIDNKLEALERIRGVLAEARAQAQGDRLERAQVGAGDDVYFVHKLDAALALVGRVRERWRRFLRALDKPAREVAELLEGVEHDADEPLWRVIQRGALRISYRREVEAPLAGTLAGHEAVLEAVRAAHRQALSGRVVIATHMHAGDGNVHTNIPVNSDDAAMMRRAWRVVEKVMAKAVELGGVISGEHGIGITKLPFMERALLEEMEAYLARVDPDDLFNPTKLTTRCDLSPLFTPSFNLMELEATILEAAELTEIVDTISPCLRCGKCKPVCPTHQPAGDLLYSPRNKVLATAAVIEAFLYESQTGEGISYESFRELADIADHCTICHHCVNPCPVDIDFGEVTERLRAFLAARGMKPRRVLASLARSFLDAEDARAVHAGKAALAAAYGAQRIAARVAGGRGDGAPKRGWQPMQFLSRPLPAITRGTARQRTGLPARADLVPVLRDARRANGRAVFYFPGCGSERLFPEIALATIGWLLETGRQVVLPPGYVCCGYPQRAGGDPARAQAISYDNRVMLHRVKQALAYLDFEAVVVSCGTCYDQLLCYELERIFPEVPLVDIHEYLVAQGVAAPGEGGAYLYHDPCHMPLKRHGTRAAIRALLGADAEKSERCCGEAGTLAVERPDVSAAVRARKERETARARERLAARGAEAQAVLTSCPACLQGLRRSGEATGLRADYLVVELARRRWGADWERQVQARVQEAFEGVPL